MLHIEYLKKYYATQKAVDDISLTIPKGCIFGLLGPNGAGKSSLLRMVTGITVPDHGSIRFNGEPLNLEQHSPFIGYMPEERGLYKKMKVGEQALYLAQLKGMSKPDALRNMDYWFTKLDMQSWRNKHVEDLSKGMSQKLQFVITVLHQPTLLILDEPFSGLDPVNSAVIKDEIHQLASKGVTIIFSTHRMEQVEEICDEIALLNKGQLILNGDVAAIKYQHKENVYQLEMNGSLDNTDFKVISYQKGIYTLQCTDQAEAAALLQFCLDHQFSIRRFEEVLPSLNDIFIRLVEGKGSARTFES